MQIKMLELCKRRILKTSLNEMTGVRVPKTLILNGSTRTDGNTVILTNMITNSISLQLKTGNQSLELTVWIIEGGNVQCSINII